MNAKQFIRLAAVAVQLLGLATVAFAQSRYTVSSEPLQQRQTGVTETAGEVTLISSDLSPSPTIPAGTNLTVTFIPASATISNDPVVNGANLIIHTPPDYTPMAVPGARLAVGALSNSLVISFTMTVPVPIGTRLRIRGVRVNVQASGITFPGQVQVQLNVSPPDVIRFDTGQTVNVGRPLPTISIAFPEPLANLLQCLPGRVTRRVVLSEQFSAVFTSLAQEDVLSNTPPPTNPTRVEVQFRNVPGGLTLEPPPSAELRGGTSEDPPRLVLNTTLSQMDRLRSAVARDILLTYDVAGQPDLGSIERTLTLGEAGQGFDFTFTTTGSLATQGLGAVEMQVRLAPVSTTRERALHGDALDAPRRVLPRFLDPPIPSPARQLFVVSPCSCNLKFSYVTNKDGLDTRIIITNSTQDPYGTPAQSGTVALYFYGQDAPPRVDLPAIAPGSLFTGYVSKLAPDFQGYIIAIANFQFCDGSAFIADAKFTKIAYGYTALVIPDPAQLGGRIPGFVARGIIDIGGVSGLITIQDTLGERLLQ